MATYKKRGVGNTPNLRPTITLDRVLVYTIGGFAVYLGLNEVWKKLNPKEENEKPPKTPDTYTGGGTSSNFEIPPKRAFPIQAINLNNPPYDRNVYLWQSLMVAVYGRNILPQFGVDGKFGYETLEATKRATNGRTYVDRQAYINLVNQANKDDDYIVVSRTKVNTNATPIEEAKVSVNEVAMGMIPNLDINLIS